jgi:hypothetical protein
MRCTDEDWTGVFEALAQGKMPAEEDMITSIVPLSRAVDGAFMELINNTSAHAKILILLRAATGIGHVMIGSTAYRVLYLGVMSD